MLCEISWFTFKLLVIIRKKPVYRVGLLIWAVVNKHKSWDPHDLCSRTIFLQVICKAKLNVLYQTIFESLGIMFIYIYMYVYSEFTSYKSS